ncbi:uncharacterized protein JCM15063_003285 [Sporobolomyces koalae]|uniref:uncharacterized protein n=1 Tax=Sporobolomyces koalae TaxID=500713 RepID=UPI003171188F
MSSSPQSFDRGVTEGNASMFQALPGRPLDDTISISRAFSHGDIDNARAAVGSQAGLAFGPTANDDSHSGERSAEDDDDVAAETLFERHAAFRELDRVLDWNEGDTERRALVLMAQLQENPPPSELVDLDDHDHDFRQAHLLAQDHTPTSEEYLRRRERVATMMDLDLAESDDEDERDHVEEAIFGFDGDQDSQEDYDASTDDYLLGGPRIGDILPGLFGERPLDLDPAATVTHGTDDIATLPVKSLEASQARDPSSSSAFTSFLAPGSTFVGQQVTKKGTTSRQQLDRGFNSAEALDDRAVGPLTVLRRIPAGGPTLQATTAHPAFSPSPRLSASRTNPPQEPSSVNGTVPANSRARTASSRYAPYSSHTAVATPTTTSIASILGAPLPTNVTPAEWIRLSLARERNVREAAARLNPASWREVADELLGRMRTDDDTTTSEQRTADPVREERWGVQVVIHSYDAEDAKLTGLMNAYGISPRCCSTCNQPTRVTTYFSGSIVQPLKSGLFVSPSPTGSGGRSADGIKVSQSTEAESWIRLGPFKKLKKSDLLRHGQDRRWVEDMTQGWVLMRWKERDFINVKATESTLSINGFYYVALNRATGIIEGERFMHSSFVNFLELKTRLQIRTGLYSDPASTPYQRLELSPLAADGTFSTGQYSMC